MWLLLINPSSGNSRGKRVGRVVKKELDFRGIAYLDLSGSSPRESWSNLRTQLSTPEIFDGLILVGGDGTLHFALQEIVGKNIALALIPAGTGNDFARALGLPLTNPEALLNKYFSSKPTYIDIGKVNDRYFINILSTGFDSLVNERANAIKWIKGRAKYNIAILLVLALFHPKRYKFIIDGVDMEESAMLIAISNGISYGGGMKVTPDARIDDGLLDIMILTPVSRLQFLRVFPKVFKGAHITHPAVKMTKAKSIEISSDAIAYADGERIGPLPVRAIVMERSLLMWRI